MSVLPLTEAQPARGESKSGLTCPACGYFGHGFHLIELVPNVLPLIISADGTVVIRGERGELRHDEGKEESNRLECPACGGEFPIPGNLNLKRAGSVAA